jgi:hypothetical protein
VVNFINILRKNIKTNKKSPKTEKGSAEAILKHWGTWQMNPGELDRILAEVQSMRDMER